MQQKNCLKENEQIGWNCIYHATYPMRVVSNAEKDELMATGDWFDHPLKVKEQHINEEQIRQQPRKRRKNGENTSCENGS